MYDIARLAEQSTNSEAERALADMVDAMRARSSRQDHGVPRRRERHGWSANIEVEIDPSMVGGGRAITATVATIDLSPAGVAFRYHTYLQTGTLVHMTLPLPGEPRVLGVVRNCIHMKGKQHRVGVKFLRIERDARAI